MVVADVPAAVEFLRGGLRARSAKVPRGGARLPRIRLGGKPAAGSPRRGEREPFFQPSFTCYVAGRGHTTYRRAIASAPACVEEPWDTPYGDRRGMVREYSRQSLPDRQPATVGYERAKPGARFSPEHRRVGAPQNRAALRAGTLGPCSRLKVRPAAVELFVQGPLSSVEPWLRPAGSEVSTATPFRTPQSILDATPHTALSRTWGRSAGGLDRVLAVTGAWACWFSGPCGHGGDPTGIDFSSRPCSPRRRTAHQGRHPGVRGRPPGLLPFAEGFRPRSHLRGARTLPTHRTAGGPSKVCTARLAARRACSPSRSARSWPPTSLAHWTHTRISPTWPCGVRNAVLAATVRPCYYRTSPLPAVRDD